MESSLQGYKGKGLSAFDKKPLAEQFGNKSVRETQLMIGWIVDKQEDAY